MDNINAPAPSLRAAAWFPLLVVAIMAVCIAFCVQLYMAMKTQGEFLQDQLTITEIRAKALANQLEGERIIQNTRSRIESSPAFSQLAIVPLRPQTPQPDAPQLVALWDHTAQQGVLVLNGELATPPEGQTYHLWISTSETAPFIHAGQILVVNKGENLSQAFAPKVPVSVFARIMLTLESVSAPVSPTLPALFAGD